MSNKDIELFLQDGIYSNSAATIDELLQLSNAQVCNIIMNFDLKKIEIKKGDIPQFSNLMDGSINLIEYLRKAGNYGPTFEEIGRHYSLGSRKKDAYRKYGENHARLAEALKLVEIRKESKQRVYLSEMGALVERMKKRWQTMSIERLAASIPIVQYCIQNQIVEREEMIMLLENYLSPQTAIRRNRNMRDLIKVVQGDWVWD